MTTIRVFCDHGSSSELPPTELDRVVLVTSHGRPFIWPGRGTILARDEPLSDETAAVVLGALEERGLTRTRYDYQCPVCHWRVQARHEKMQKAMRELHGHGVSEVSLRVLQRMINLV